MAESSENASLFWYRWRRAWELVLDNLGTYFGLLLIFSGVPVLLEMSLDAMLPGTEITIGEITQTQAHPLAAIIQLCTTLFVFIPISSGVFVTAAHQLWQGHTPTIRESLQHGLHHWQPMIGTVLRIFVYVFIGLLMLIVPGIIRGIASSFVIYDVVLQEQPSKVALQNSIAQTNGLKWTIAGVMGAATLQTFLFSIVLGMFSALFGLMGSVVWIMLINVLVGFVGIASGIVMYQYWLDRNHIIADETPAK